MRRCCLDKATGRLEVNPETAPYVQELFARYADGERLTVLQAEMEERGLRSKRGNAYTVSVLSNLLKNRKYIGEYKYGDVITPDGIPAIIDKELFERVQMRMAANKKAPARAKAEEEYLLTTKLYCGDCGRLMAGESGKGCKGIVYHYYKCSGAKRRLGCKKKAIKKHWIEEVVVSKCFFAGQNMLPVEVAVHHRNGGSIPVEGINQGRDFCNPCLSCGV